jgi:hypothetical protein
MKRLKAARNAATVSLATTSMWTAYVAKQTKIAILHFVIVLLRVVPNLNEMGSA